MKEAAIVPPKKRLNLVDLDIFYPLVELRQFDRDLWEKDFD